MVVFFGTFFRREGLGRGIPLEVEVLLHHGYICFCSLSYQELGCWHIVSSMLYMTPGSSLEMLWIIPFVLFHGKLSNSFLETALETAPTVVCQRTLALES